MIINTPITPTAECLAVDMSLPVLIYDLGLSGLGFEHPIFRLRGQRSYLLRHRRGYDLM